MLLLILTKVYLVTATTPAPATESPLTGINWNCNKKLTKEKSSPSVFFHSAQLPQGSKSRLKMLLKYQLRRSCIALIIGLGSKWSETTSPGVPWHTAVHWLSHKQKIDRNETDFRLKQCSLIIIGISTMATIFENVKSFADFLFKMERMRNPHYPEESCHPILWSNISYFLQWSSFLLAKMATKSGIWGGLDFWCLASNIQKYTFFQ